MQIVGEWMGSAAADDRSEERALLARARAGDTAAMEDLLGAHERPIFALCCGVLGNSHDAEDAVQESFLRALRALPRFRGESGVRTWLYRIALNVCLEWKRTRNRGDAVYDRHFHAHSPESAALQNLRIVEALRK